MVDEASVPQWWDGTHVDLFVADGGQVAMGEEKGVLRLPELEAVGSEYCLYLDRQYCVDAIFCSVPPGVDCARKMEDFPSSLSRVCFPKLE